MISLKVKTGTKNVLLSSNLENPISIGVVIHDQEKQSSKAKLGDTSMSDLDSLMSMGATSTFIRATPSSFALDSFPNGYVRPKVVAKNCTGTFSKHSVRAFGLDNSSFTTIGGENWALDVAKGGSVNCQTISFCPHSAGTHTECIGHIVPHGPSILSFASRNSFLKTLLLNICPVPFVSIPVEEKEFQFSVKEQENSVQYTSLLEKHASDFVICKSSIQEAVSRLCINLKVTQLEMGEIFNNICIRTFSPQVVSSEARTFTASSFNNYHSTSSKKDPLPCTSEQTADFSNKNPPYFTAQAMHFLVNCFPNIESLVVDLPSIDREDDGGLVRNHKIFFDFSKTMYSVLGSELTRLDEKVIQSKPMHFWTSAKKDVPSRLLTELVWYPETVKEGVYLSQLHVAPFDSDASPSGPILYAANLSK